MTLDEFVDKLYSCSHYYPWQFVGSYIGAIKDGRYYDPMTALTEVLCGTFHERTSHKPAEKLGLSTEDAWDITRAIDHHAGDKDWKRLSLIRERIISACNLTGKPFDKTRLVHEETTPVSNKTD